MAGLNRCTFIGNLGAEPELKHTPTNQSVCNLRIAVNETWKDKSGQKQERVEWVRVVAWGDLADNCAKYLSKGRQVYVEGKMQTRTYDKDGAKHYATDIVASNVVFLGGGGERDESSGARRGSGGGGAYDAGRSVEQPPSGGPPPADDDIPFLRLD